MVQGFFDLLFNVNHPVLLALAVSGLVFGSGGILFLLLSGGVHFVGFHPPDPGKFPGSSANLRRFGIGLLVLGLAALSTSGFTWWWSASSVGSLSDALRGSQGKLEKLSQEAHAQEVEISALKEELAKELKNRHDLELQISEAKSAIKQHGLNSAEARQAIEAKYANQIAELSLNVKTLEKEKAQHRDEIAQLQEVAESKNREIAAANEKNVGMSEEIGNLEDLLATKGKAVKDLQSYVAALKAQIARLKVQDTQTTKVPSSQDLDISVQEIGTSDIVSAIDPARRALENLPKGTSWSLRSDAAKLGLAYEAFYSYPISIQKSRRNRTIGQLLANADRLCQKVKSAIAKLDDNERKQFPAPLIVSGIDAKRVEKLNAHKLRQIKTITDYPIEAAVRDVLDYHNQCTLLVGLGEARRVSSPNKPVN